MLALTLGQSALAMFILFGMVIGGIIVRSSRQKRVNNSPFGGGLTR